MEKSVYNNKKNIKIIEKNIGKISKKYIIRNVMERHKNKNKN